MTASGRCRWPQETRASTATATNTNIRYTFENAKNLIARFGVGSRCSASACTTNTRAEHERGDGVEPADVAREGERERQRDRDHRVRRDLPGRDLGAAHHGKHRDAGRGVVVAVLHRERPEVRGRPEEHDGEEDPGGERRGRRGPRPSRRAPAPRRPRRRSRCSAPCAASARSCTRTRRRASPTSVSTADEQVHHGREQREREHVEHDAEHERVRRVDLTGAGAAGRACGASAGRGHARSSS